MQSINTKSNVYLRNLFIRGLMASSTSAKASRVKSWKEIPGPSSFPVIGQLHHFMPGGSLYKKPSFELWDTLYKSYGPIVKLSAIFKPDVLVLMEADSMAQVYHGENSFPIRPGLISVEYYRKKHNKTKEESERNTGLASEHGKKWKEFRAIVNPVMMHPTVLQLYAKGIDDVAQDVVARLRTLRDENDVVSGKFDYEMKLWALETIYFIAIGKRLNCLVPNLPEDSTANVLMKATNDLLVCAEELDYKPSLWKYYPTKAFKRAMKAYEHFEVVTRRVIDDEAVKLKMSGTRSDDEKGILEKLLDIDENVAYVMTSDLIGGGFDTVSNAMTAVLYLIATNPEKQQKLREEVMSNQGKSYMKACIKEALRLLPPAAFNLRVTTRDYTILDYHVPKGTHVMFCHLYTSLMEEYYPRPHEFIPERWIVDQTHPLYYGNAKPFAYAPFGFGFRSCIGRRIVDMEVETFLKRIIENFHLGWTGPPPTVVPALVHRIMSPFGFIFKDV